MTTESAPPPAATRQMPRLGAGVKRMTPSRFQLPPRPSGASASTCGAPPVVSTVLSLPPAKNPTDRPSADQNGNAASSVPVSGCACIVSSERIHSCGTPRRGAATNASRPPSGDKASCTVEATGDGDQWVPGGGMTSKRISRAGAPRGGKNRREAAAPTARATTPARARLPQSARASCGRWRRPPRLPARETPRRGGARWRDPHRSASARQGSWPDTGW